MSVRQPSFDDFACFLPLTRAARRAARGKKLTREVAAFLLDLEPESFALERELHAGTYRPRPYRTFQIRDPKPRTISAAAFRDRVVHHALCAAMEPTFETLAIADSYACRVGKGVHRAVHRLQILAATHPRFLHLDVLHFFETADHEVLRAALRRHFDDLRLLDVCDRFIGAGAPGSAPGRGLPIGNLTSQHFANFYLAPLDRFITETLRVPGYVRYMDDLLLFGPDRTTMRAWRVCIARFVADELRLTLKDSAERSGPVSVGVPALGFRIWPQLIRLDGARVRRFRRNVRALQPIAISDSDAAVTAARRVESLVSWTTLADAPRMRRAFFDRLAGRTREL